MLQHSWAWQRFTSYAQHAMAFALHLHYISSAQPAPKQQYTTMQLEHFMQEPVCTG